MLVQVHAPHFCAAIVLTGHVVTEAAPILSWTIGERRQDPEPAIPHIWGMAYLVPQSQRRLTGRRRGWKAIIVSTWS